MQRRVEAASFLVLFLLGLSFLVSDVAALGGAVYTSTSITTTAAAISTKTLSYAANAAIEYSCIFVGVQIGEANTITVSSITDGLSLTYSAISGASSGTTSDFQWWGANDTSSSTAADIINVHLSGTTAATGQVLIQTYRVTGLVNGGCTTANAAYHNSGTGSASATVQLAAAQTPGTGDFCLVGWAEQIRDTVAITWTALALPYIAGPTLGTASTTAVWDRLQTAYVLNYLPVIGSTKFSLAATGGTVTVFDWDMGVACMPATVLATVTSTSTTTATVTTTTTSVSTTTTTSTATTTVLAAGIQANATLVQQISPGKTLLLSSTVTGGTGQGYSYQWYSGSSATCTSDLTTLGTASTQAVSPVTSTFYCYKVADSGANSQYSSTVDVTVAALETTTSTTTVTTPTTTTVTDTSTSTSTVTSNQTLTSTTTVTTPTTTTETSTSTYSTTTTVINNSTYTVVNDVTYQVGVGGPGGTTTTTLYQNSTTTAQGQPITTVGLAGIALIVVAVVAALMVTNTKVTVNGKRRL